MNRWKKSQEIIEEKRKIKKQKEEMEEMKIIARQNSVGKRSGSSNRLIERMDADIEERNLRKEKRKILKEEMINKELSHMFRPKTNKNYRRGIMPFRFSLRGSKQPSKDAGFSP